MICCAAITIPFNEAVTTVSYSPVLEAIYGQEPNVQVYYREGTEYVLSDDMNSVKLIAGDIVADHGGVQVGFIKIF
jgi:hypothetical protein